MATRGFLLVDANVLVDYQEADLGILALVSRRLGTVHIVSTVLREVDLDEHDCARLGIRVVEPTIAQLIAATPSNGRLSLPDRLCLEVCREHAWTGVSNDKALRRACEAGGVAVRWGLELMLELVRAGHLASAVAVDAAERMHVANPHFLGAAILASFRSKLAKLVR
jgi:predicted nucleic acid-binding protein